MFKPDSLAVYPPNYCYSVYIRILSINGFCVHRSPGTNPLKNTEGRLYIECDEHKRSALRLCRVMDGSFHDLNWKRGSPECCQVVNIKNKVSGYRVDVEQEFVCVPIINGLETLR